MRGLIVGTGWSLRGVIDRLRYFDGLLFCPNNTPADLIAAGCDPRRMVWLGNDPHWHDHYGQQVGWFSKWHWRKDICVRYGYTYVEGIEPGSDHGGWHGGLWLKDCSKIALNHCATAALLNLALNQYACTEAVLIGHDFHYDGPQRHYFDNLSDVPGEYPAALRKVSLFDKSGKQHDLLTVYREISETPDCPPILNATEGSKLPWFPRVDLEAFCESGRSLRTPEVAD